MKMAQVALKIETNTQVTEWDAMVAAVRSAASVQALTGADDKAARDALKAAERVAAWHIFDACQGDADAAQELVEAVAEAKGASDAVCAVMRQRARDMVTTYREGVAKANREKSSPLTVAKRLREQREETASKNEARRPYYAAAAEHVAAQLGEGWDAVRVLAEKADDATLQAAFDEAVDVAMGRAGLIADALAMATRLREAPEATARALVEALGPALDEVRAALAELAAV